MTERFSDYVLALCAVSLCAALLSQLAGDGKLKSIMKLIGAAAVCTVLLAPLGKLNLNIPRSFDPLRDITASSRELDDMRIQAQEMCIQCVRDYVTALGAERGMDVGCDCSCRYENGGFYMEYCRVTFKNTPDEAARRDFLAAAADGLGVEEGFITGG